MSMQHVTCTAKMGQDELAVVNAKLRVCGVSNLRIAGGFLVSRITTGNTHAPCVMIGERRQKL